MKLPHGRLIRRRVVDDLGTPLQNALETELTGYARLEPQDTLLLDAHGVGVLIFEDGVPTMAYHTGTDTGGSTALADVAVAGPYRLELHELDDEVLEGVHSEEDLLVPPGLPAERLAGDLRLAERTRAVAPEDCPDAESGSPASLDAVETFLEDDEVIAIIQERARDEAETRADEWGFDVQAPD